MRRRDFFKTIPVIGLSFLLTPQLRPKMRVDHIPLARRGDEIRGSVILREDIGVMSTLGGNDEINRGLNELYEYEVQKAVKRLAMRYEQRVFNGY